MNWPLSYFQMMVYSILQKITPCRQCLVKKASFSLRDILRKIYLMILIPRSVCRAKICTQLKNVLHKNTGPHRTRRSLTLFLEPGGGGGGGTHHYPMFCPTGSILSSLDSRTGYLGLKDWVSYCLETLKKNRKCRFSIQFYRF